nr:hypothetical protein CFP56_69992 [Quercus suber]
MRRGSTIMPTMSTSRNTLHPTCSACGSEQKRAIPGIQDSDSYDLEIRWTSEQSRGWRFRVLSSLRTAYPPGEGEPRIKELSYLTNLSYVNAVRSLRLSIGSRTAEDAAVLPFGCLLLALLESFRDSPREMLIHLNSGVQMISEMSTSLRTSSDIREIAGMIQDNCIECRLFCASPAYTGDFAAVTMALEIDPITLSELSHAKDLSLELNRIVGATMRTMHRMRKAGNDVKRRNSLFSSMIKLCYRWDRLRALLEKEEVGSKIQSPGRSCLRAGYILMGIFLHSATSGVKPGSGEEIASFIEIVDLVENALNQLDCIDAYDQKRPQSFTVGLRTIQLLDAVITQCPDTPLRFRALRLLDRSPRKEGLWTASSTRDACLAILQSECDKASKESRRDMPVRPRENSDPPNSQAQLTPGILRHLEGPAHSLDQSIADQDD